MPTIVAAFPSADKARVAKRELAQAGVPEGKMLVVGPQNWFDAQAALAEPEQSIVAGRAGAQNPEMATAVTVGDLLNATRAQGDLPGGERQWLNHVLLLVRDLEEGRISGTCVALRQLGAEHVLAR